MTKNDAKLTGFKVVSMSRIDAGMEIKIDYY